MAAEERNLKSPFYSISRNYCWGLVFQASEVYGSIGTEKYNLLNYYIQGSIRVSRLWPKVILDSVFEVVPDLLSEGEEKV
jgi:hypothetical protein